MDTFEKAAKKQSLSNIDQDNLAMLRGLPEYQKAWNDAKAAAEAKDWSYFSDYVPKIGAGGGSAAKAQWTAESAQHRRTAGEDARQHAATWTPADKKGNVLVGVPKPEGSRAEHLAKGEALEYVSQKEQDFPTRKEASSVVVVGD